MKLPYAFVILLALIFLIYGKSIAGYCASEYDMWCSSQEPQTCADENYTYPACN